MNINELRLGNSVARKGNQDSILIVDIDLLPDAPKTPTDHALLGYLFGYDTDSICKYIIKYCELNEPNLM